MLEPLIPTTNPDIILGRDPADPVPGIAIALEVDFLFDEAAKRFALEIVKIGKSTGSFKAHEDFLEWAKGQIASPKWGPTSGFNNTAGKRKPTKMSLKYKKPFYLLIKLSDNWNWRFSADGAPLSMDSYWSGKGVFQDAYSFDSAGALVTRPSPNITCKNAYTIVNCDKAKETPGSDDFEARYNLHVDLVEDPSDLANSPYIPLILDPDVRWPGGDGP